ncbi:hypothetical protein yc1106_01311 [Curvularia clavata]|uniref:Uncharacterized protein n=1 Tax=Curvularia clavata TaxID=95742 RepID=A0A9Q8Z0W0_CURCL|nr:hypothetical protein yc1106_01311 [Curvularia clavata]
MTDKTNQMPVAQYRCLDQNQGVAATEQVVDIARRLKDGNFKEVPIKDQLWAVNGENLVLTSTPSPRKHDVFRRLFDDIRNRRTPTPTQGSPLGSAALFSLVLSKCMRSQSDFLEASQTVVNEASTGGVTAFNELHEQLKKLPEPEKSEYDSDLRQLIDKLIRIQDEIRWLNIISTVSRNIVIFLDACSKQQTVKRGLMNANISHIMHDIHLYESQLRVWDRAIIDQLNIMRQLNDSQIPNVQAQIKDLFEFKQSLSNVLSSQFQLRQADASTRSGNIIMYFTMMTILFSSLSFMAAFFALNIRSFPRNDQGDVELSMSYVASRIGKYIHTAEMRTPANNPANSIIVAWSIAIAAPFWLLAAFLNPMADFLDWLLPGWLSPEKVSSNAGNP